MAENIAFTGKAKASAQDVMNNTWQRNAQRAATNVKRRNVVT
jgi:hypothetical protein